MHSEAVGFPEKRVYCITKRAQAAGPPFYYENYAKAFDGVATRDGYES